MRASDAASDLCLIDSLIFVINCRSLARTYPAQARGTAFRSFVMTGLVVDAADTALKAALVCAKRRTPENDTQEMCRAKLLAAGVGGGSSVGVDGVAAALFGEALEEILEFRPLARSEDLANLIAALLANLFEFRIHLVVDDVVAVLHIRQYLPDLFLLFGRKLELGGKVGDRSRRIWPRLQKGRRLRLRARPEDAVIGDRMAHSAERHAQNKYKHDQRQGLAIIGTKLH
jgi:hypothetical protein